MARHSLVAVVASVLMLGLALAGTSLLTGVAQEATPTHDMAAMWDGPAGNVGLKSVVLARMQPAAAPGLDLQLVRVEVASGATVAPHNHPGAIVLCLESGSPVFGVVEGTVTLTHAETATTPEAAESVTAGAEIELQPGDCLTFDASVTVHTLRNPGGPAVIWQAHLYATGQPATTFLATPTP